MIERGRTMQPKRIIVTLLAVILICLAAVTTVSAAEASPVKLGVSVSSDTAVSNAPVTVQAGDTLKVSVTVAENPGIRLLQFNLVYDPAVLSVKTEGSVVSTTWGEGFSDAPNKSVTLVEPGVLKVMISASKAVASETIVTVDFTAVACVADKKGETSIATDVKGGIAADGSYNELKLAADSAKAIIHDELIELEADESPCVTAGLKCPTCGAIPVETASHHVMKPVAEVPASCTATGTTAGEKCENCDYKTGIEEIPMLDHDTEDHEAKAPDCLEAGWDAYVTCKNCDYTTKVEIPALGHDLKDVAAQAPNCTDEGWAAYQECQREGCDYNTKEILPALGHDLKHYDAKAVTCIEDGWDAYDVCQREGCDYNTQEIIKANGKHTIVADPEVAPTYSSEGKTAGSHCSVCGEIIVAQDVIPAKSLLWLWILIAVVVVAAAGVVVYFFVFKKQAKIKHIGRPGAKK